MGEDKGLMTLYDKPMIAYVLEEFEKLTANILIISNNDNYQRFGFPVFKDKHKEKGPLAGMLRGLEQSTTEKNIILSCDVPYLKVEVINYLLERSEERDATVAQHQERIHPLIGIYQKRCTPVFENQLKKGALKITDSFNNLDVLYVNMDRFDQRMFKNINSKRDL